MGANNFMGSSVSANCTSNRIGLKYCATMVYVDKNIHYNSFRVTTTLSRFKGLGSFSFGAIVGLTPKLLFAFLHIALFSPDSSAFPDTNSSAHKPGLAQVSGISIDLHAIAQIESSGRASAVGDGGKALGMYQLHQGVITDYNRAHNARIKHQDALEPKIGLMVASWYLNTKIPQYLAHYRLPDTLENRLTAYNQGILSVIKGRVAHEYVRRYRIFALHSGKNKTVGQQNKRSLTHEN